jgi:hypothetical protein
LQLPCKQFVLLALLLLWLHAGPEPAAAATEGHDAPDSSGAAGTDPLHGSPAAAEARTRAAWAPYLRLLPRLEELPLLLGEKSAAALQRVFEVGQRLSGLSDDDVEELAKN